MCVNPFRHHRCFHPLKAGRRPVIGLPVRVGGGGFPSPQGGSETVENLIRILRIYEVSIPSRRVGDDSSFFAKFLLNKVSIPSRRVGDLTKVGDVCAHRVGFHPLKAGRRRDTFILFSSVFGSFPSPQGGSETIERSPSRWAFQRVSIPSRRVGDRLRNARIFCKDYVSIPSRRVGDSILYHTITFARPVSIPSRRVGDQEWVCDMCNMRISFHPLKAGRRLVV